MKLNLENKKALLVVVDMVNGFATSGALADPIIQNIIPRISTLIDNFIVSKRPILAFIDAHEENAIEFNSFPMHCIKGSYESELVDLLIPYKEKMTCLEKNSTNGFFAPGFTEFLTNNLPLDTVIITGCCTDICVLQFALALKTYFNQNDLASNIIIPKDCVDTFGTPEHLKSTYNKFALDLLTSSGIIVVDHLEIEGEK